MNKKKISIILFVVSALCLLTSLIILIYPTIYDYQCRTRYYSDFESKATDEIMKSNIVVVRYEEKANGNVTSMSYGLGSSGVVFASDADKYYALTAYHVVKDCDMVEYIIVPYGAPTIEECRENSETHIPNGMYYEQFSRAKVEFADEEYDLAVISFETDCTINMLDLSEANPKYNEKIMVIGNPEGERFIKSYGRIKSKDYFVFDSEDGLSPTKAYKHNAYENHGSSGSVVLNEDMKIVGINIGGGTDSLGRFKYGAMVPCEQIKEFLEKWSA